MLAAQGTWQSCAVHLAVAVVNSSGTDTVHSEFCKADRDRPTPDISRPIRASGRVLAVSTWHHFTEKQRILELCAGGDDLEEHRRARNGSGIQPTNIPTEYNRIKI